MKAVIFPGQGTHYAGMWSRMQSKVASSIYHQVSTALHKVLPNAQPDDPSWLESTVNAQPTILALSYAYWLNSGIKADLLLGHSLGEYTALTAAGVFNFSDALWLVHQRGMAMEECKGVLHAVRNANVVDNIYVSAHNASRAWNVAAKDSDTIKHWCRHSTHLANYPFHSPLMQPAIEPFTAAISKFEMHEPSAVLVSNLTARPHCVDVRSNLIRHVTEMVRWHESIQYCLAKGVKHFVEMGPNCVFSRLLRREYPELTIE